MFENSQNPLNLQIVSGDDTFLLHSAKKSGRKILVLKSSAATVRTAGCRTVSEYISQRVRWASKARYYKDNDTILLALLVAITNLSIITAFIMLLTGRLPWVFPLLFAIKIVADYVFLNSFAGSSGKKLPAAKFLIYSLVYPFITVFVAIAGVVGGFSWKGRRYRH
jgi:hypothetical protein